MSLLARYRRNWIFVIVALLATPMLVQLFEARATVSEREARTLAPRPDVPKTLLQWRQYPRALDRFLSDHFGLRDALVRINGLIRYAVVSPTDLRVVYGRGRWLFFNGDGMLQQSMGLLRRERDIKAFADFAAHYRDHLARKNTAFLVAVPPNSATILGNQLPEWAGSKPVESEYDLMMRALASRNVKMVDLRPALAEANAEEIAYLRTDTHWTKRGALVGYNAVVAALGHPDWTIDPKLVVRGHSRIPGGDLARMLGVSADVNDVDSIIDLSPYAPRAFEVTSIDTHQRETGGSVTQTGRQGPTVVILGDSFTEHYWRRYFALHVARYVWIHHELCGFVPEIADAFKPDAVILAPTERFMFCWNLPPVS
jgi:alginate O-acetyltransferase complex protein AlgJ